MYFFLLISEYILLVCAEDRRFCIRVSESEREQGVVAQVREGAAPALREGRQGEG